MKQWEIQRAVYQTLVGHQPLMDIIDAVYDHVPQDSSYPYVVIGDDTGLQWDTGSSVGTESTLTIHVWSRELGRKETKEIMNLVYEVLHLSNLPIEDMVSVLCHWEFSETFLDPDGITRHGVSRFRIIADEGETIPES